MSGFRRTGEVGALRRIASKISPEPSPRKAMIPSPFRRRTAPNEQVRACVQVLGRAPARATCRQPFRGWSRDWSAAARSELVLLSRWIECRAAAPAPTGCCELGQSEVENLGVTALGHEKVGGLDVTMDDALGMGSVERVGGFNGKGQNGLDFQGPPRNAMLPTSCHPETPWR